jgi:hypothetical protein
MIFLFERRLMTDVAIRALSDSETFSAYKQIVAQNFQDLKTLALGNTPIVIDARKYLKGDGTPEDLSQVRAWIAAGVAVSAMGGVPVMSAKGTFRLTIDTTYGGDYGERKALLFSQIHNAQFDCEFATWLFDSAGAAASYANVFNLYNSDNVSGNFGTVDWVIKPFVQGVITKGSSFVDITLDSGFTAGFSDIQRLEVYSRDKLNLFKILSKDFSGGANVTGWPASSPTPGVLRIDFTGDAAALAYLNTLTNGDVIVATPRVYGGDAFRFIGCRNLRVRAAVVTTGGMSYRANDCTNLQIDAYTSASVNALISSTADGIHIEGARGHCDISGSIFHTGDDPLNITNDSYVVHSVTSARQFTMYSGYPFILPRVGDVIAGVNDSGVSTVLGKVVTINTTTGDTIIDTDLPAAMDATWQIVNLSAFPVTTFTKTFVAEKCRGHVRLQVPSVSGHVRAADLTGSITVEYIPYFTGEGIPPSSTTLFAEALRCAMIQSLAGAVMVQAYQLAGGGYSSAGALSRIVLNAVVRNTKNSGVFLAGVSQSCVSAITDTCCTAPDTTNFSLATNTVALINCTNVYLTGLTHLDVSGGTVGTSGSTGIVKTNLANYT